MVTSEQPNLDDDIDDDDIDENVDENQSNADIVTHFMEDANGEIFINEVLHLNNDGNRNVTDSDDCDDFISNDTYGIATTL